MAWQEIYYYPAPRMYAQSVVGVYVYSNGHAYSLLRLRGPYNLSQREHAYIMRLLFNEHARSSVGDS